MAITHEQLLEVAHCTGAALEKSEKAQQNQTILREKVAAAMPLTKQALLRSGLVEAHEAEELDRVLNDHELLLRFTTKLAQHHAACMANPPSVDTPMGQSVDNDGNPVVKSASHSNHVGKRDGQLKESDLAYYRALGIEVK